MCRPRMSISIFMLVLFLSPLIISTESVKTSYSEILENENVIQKLNLLQPKNLLNILKDLSDDDADVNNNCDRDLAIYQQALDREELWALKMLDASSKIPIGILKGHVMDIGMFDECLDIKETLNTGIEIYGQHCMYAINPTLSNNIFPFKPELSICLPHNCGDYDVTRLINKTIRTFDKYQDFNISLAYAKCSTTNNVKTWNANIKFWTALLVLYVSFLLLCTLYDIGNRIFRFKIINSDELWITLSRLSLLKIAESILSTKPQKNDVPVIHGIRIIGTITIVLLHESAFHCFNTINFLDAQEFLKNWTAPIVLVLGIHAVDTFLTLSGFLVAYRFFNQIKEEKKFNPFLHYLHRYIRLTPTLAVLFIYNYFIIQIGSGPKFNLLQDTFSTGFQSKWWSFLLYINNFVDQQNICFIHLWSLAVDMQLFWISPFILYPLHKKPKLGLTILSLLLLASAIISAFIVGVNKYSSIHITVNPDFASTLEIFHNVYSKPYTRAAPWLIGILFGYEVTQQNIKPNKSMLNIGWFLAFASLSFCIFGFKIFINVDYDYNPILEMIFAALARPLWSFAVCWIIYASIHNYAGLITTILSWKKLLPLSRISYSIYVVHAIFLLFKNSMLRVSSYFSGYLIAYAFISTMFISIIIGFLVTLMFEVPMSILESILFKSNGQSRIKAQKSK